MNTGRLRFSKDVNVFSKLSVCEQLLSLPEHIEAALEMDIGVLPKSSKVCIFGIGESSIAGDIISAYADDCSDIPVPNYCSDLIPGWVDGDTDVILISYSGSNTVINNAYDKVVKRGCRVYCIVCDGKLADKCKKDGNRVLSIPEGLTSRSALGYELGLLAILIERMGICDARSRLESVLPSVKEYRDSVFTDERIEDLKFKLHDNTIAIYGSPDFRASFKRWKMSLNDDMGSPAFCGELPEFNHNEIVGWANHNQNDKDLRIVMLRGKYKNDVLTRIIDKTMEVLEESGRHVIDVRILGSDPIEKNLRAIILGDYISQLMKYESKTPMSWVGSL